MMISLRARSVLPRFFTLAALVCGLGAAQPALADALYLDPAHTTCKVESMGGGAKRCSVLFDDLVIHEGREIGLAEANGDFVKCRSVILEAKSLGRDIVMLRGYNGSQLADWDQDNFFTVAGQPPRCQ